MNNIDFSIVSNQTRTKFKIAWTIKLGDYPITKVMSREFPTEESAQEFIDNNQEKLLQKIREKISKMIINVNEQTKETAKEETTEEVSVESTEEVVEETPENEEVSEVETTEEVEENTDTIVVGVSEETEMSEEEIKDEAATYLPETEEEIVVEETEETEEVTEETVEETSENEEVSEVETTEEVEENTDTIVVGVLEDDNEIPENNEVKSLVPVDAWVEEDAKVARRTNRKVKIATRIASGIIALALVVGVAHLAKNCSSDQPTNDIPVTDIPTDSEKTLTTEEFTNMVANLAKVYKDKGIDLTTEDVTKFVAILNIDTLVEENPELASELFKNSTKEEYIQDAAKTISATVMYNGKLFEEEKSTTNFIRISDALYGEQQTKLASIETYVDEIAKVYYNQEEANILTADLIKNLATGELQNLESGAQFGMQISIELIRSYIAKDVLTDVNRDVLTDITRLNVSDIMTKYDSVNNLSGNSKTLK